MRVVVWEALGGAVAGRGVGLPVWGSCGAWSSKFCRIGTKVTGSSRFESDKMILNIHA